MTPKTINLKKTLAQTKGRITVPYIAKQTTRGADTVKKWIEGGTIPETVIDRLMEVLEMNDVEIVYNDE